jgi:hypothetical protein
MIQFTGKVQVGFEVILTQKMIQKTFERLDKKWGPATEGYSLQTVLIEAISLYPNLLGITGQVDLDTLEFPHVFVRRSEVFV